MIIKKCCHCKKELSLDSFQKNRATKDGLQHRCKACTSRASKACRAKRGHLWLEKTDPWKNRNDANRLRSNASHRACRAKHPEKDRVQNRRWRETINPFSVAVGKARLRAAELDVISTLTVEEWRRVVEEQDFICHVCGERTVLDLKSPLRLSLDHVLPMSRGGQNIMENVLPAHRRCNQSRSDMTLEEFDIWLNKIYVSRRSAYGKRP